MLFPLWVRKSTCAQAQGVGGADIRRGQGVARHEEVSPQEALAGERRGAGDRRGPKRKAAARVLGQGTEEVGAGRGPAASGTDLSSAVGTLDEPSHRRSQRIPRELFNTLPSSENQSRCLQTTDHPDQGSEDANKPHKQAQRADLHSALHTPLTIPLKSPRFLCRSRPRFS
jgi:hypothetical protein